MFKLFPGYDIVEAYHNWKRHRRTSRPANAKIAKLSIVMSVTLLLWFMPSSSLFIPGLTVVEHRLIAIFAFATLMWILEAVPSWTTSVAVVVLLLLTVSDSSLWFMRDVEPERELGTLVKYKSIIQCFADPIIMLFIGGFILAIAATKTGLDVTVARALLKPFGTQSKYVLLGFILITAVFSMFISNTATAAMMLTFLAPVLKTLPADGKGKIGLALSIPIAANVGGIATPIGTPPNAIALKYLNDPEGLDLDIGFGEWTALMLPFALLLLFLSWILLLRLFPFKQKTIELRIEGEARHDWRSAVVYATFAVTVLLWMFDKLTGVNANAVAMIPIAVFCLTGIITKKDLEEISWSVLWMVAGGFALGVALNESGLAQDMIEAIPFETWSPVAIIIGSGLLCWGMANFISHTATAALLVPILSIVGISMKQQLAPMGGVETLLIGVALGSSLAMVLPISTPPNALAHATGMVAQKDMEKVGIIIGIAGLLLGYTLLIVSGSAGII